MRSWGWRACAPAAPLLGFARVASRGRGCGSDGQVRVRSVGRADISVRFSFDPFLQQPCVSRRPRRRYSPPSSRCRSPSWVRGGWAGIRTKKNKKTPGGWSGRAVARFGCSAKHSRSFWASRDAPRVASRRDVSRATLAASAAGVAWRGHVRGERRLAQPADSRRPLTLLRIFFSSAQRAARCSRSWEI